MAAIAPWCHNHQWQRRLLTSLLGVLVILVVVFPTTKCQDVAAAVGAVDEDTVDSHTNPHQRLIHDDNEKRLWGASSSYSSSLPSLEEDATATTADRPVSAIPFLKSKPDSSKALLDPFAGGFQISARVYTDPQDKLAHFEMYDVGTNHDGDDNDDVVAENPIVFPYWECGVAGSTTVPIPLQHVTVRHLLGGSIPASFASEGDFGPHPQLVVPLTKVQVVLNSGQSRTFSPGQVILLENVITGGHKLQGHEQRDMTVLLLTLPHVYHQVGRDHNALQLIFEKSFWKQNPCRTGRMTTTATTTPGGTGGNSQQQCTNVYDPYHSSDPIRSFRLNVLARWVGPPRAMRRIGLGAIGFVLSMVLADFLGKCAPLGLAVAFGGGAIVAGGTFGLVRLGEYGLDELDIWHEKRLLRLTSSSSPNGGDPSPVSTPHKTSSSGEETAKQRIPGESGGSDHSTPPLRAFSSAQEYI
jgi:hypothetical protein